MIANLPRGVDRRSLVLSALSVAACGASAPERAPGPVRPLKALAPFPVGVCATVLQLDEQAWRELVLTQFNQITPEWQMKMESILQPDFSLRFDAPDRIVDFARSHGMRVHGHALIWYAQGEDAFANLSSTELATAFDRYVAGVAGHYRGKVVGWDVVNEPVTDEGSELRTCHWSRLPGPESYIGRAFQIASEADPEAVLFLNDYNLESNPAKGATFLRLVERLLRAGIPVGGIGIQSHLDIETPAGRISDFVREAARFGLPVHISEVDASLRNGRSVDFRSPGLRNSQQVARVGELAEAFMALPPAQRYAFTVWGARDIDSPLRRDERDDGEDRPTLFDAQGRPNPTYFAVARAFGAGGGSGVSQPA